jgi:hypothetical protein
MRKPAFTGTLAAGISQGLIYLYQQPKSSYPNKPLYFYFQIAI